MESTSLFFFRGSNRNGQGEFFSTGNWVTYLHRPQRYVWVDYVPFAFWWDMDSFLDVFFVGFVSSMSPEELTNVP